MRAAVTTWRTALDAYEGAFRTWHSMASSGPEPT